MAPPRILLLLLLALAACLPKPGLLILAHGGRAEWNALVEEVVSPLRERLPVAIAYGMTNPEAVREAVVALEGQGAERIVAVTLFISGDAFGDGYDAIFEEMEAARREAEVPRAVVVRASGGLMDSALAGRILLHRARTLTRDAARESVLVLAHGPGSDEENERWLAHISRAARPLARLGFREIRVETMREDWPERRAAARARIRAYVAAGSAAGVVLVIPFRIAGFGPYAKVLEGLDYIADGRGLAPHPLLTTWIRRQALGCLAECVSP